MEKRKKYDHISRLLVSFAFALLLALAGGVFGGYLSAAAVSLVYKVNNTLIIAIAVCFFFGLAGSFIRIEHEPGYDGEKRVKMLAKCIKAYMITVFLMLCAYSFTLGITGRWLFLIIPSYLFYGYFARFANSHERDKRLLDIKKKDLPYLYKMTDKAKKLLGIGGRIRISLGVGCSSGARLEGGAVRLILGAVPMQILSEDEFFQIILHTLIVFRDSKAQSDMGALAEYIFKGANAKYIRSADTIFSPLWKLFLEEYRENVFSQVGKSAVHADSVTAQIGNAQLLANAIGKMTCEALFEYEAEKWMSEPFYEPETMRRDSVSRRCEAFKIALKERGDKWKELRSREIRLIEDEPMLSVRLNELGIDEYDISLPNDSGEFRQESEKALLMWDEYGYKNIESEYASLRKLNYLMPLETIQKWEQEGKKLGPDTYRDIVSAYMALLKYDEAEKICDHVIANEQNRAATAYARYIKGLRLIHDYDVSGIPLIYEAIDLNMNYAGEGLDAIAGFASMMGLEDELQRCREKADDMDEKLLSFEEAGFLNAFDEVIEDPLPREYLDDILDEMLKAGAQHIKRVYLVRKIISEDFNTSAFVIEFAEKTKDEDELRIINRMFNYLDTLPYERQFSLFKYNDDNAIAVKRVNNSCVLEDGKKIIR